MTRNPSFGQRPVIAQHNSSTSLHQPASPAAVCERRASDQAQADERQYRPLQPPPPRSRPTVLGSGFLRPLTRVGNTSPTGQPHPQSQYQNQNQNQNQPPNGISRTQSSAALYSTSPRISPATEHPQTLAPPMLRSSTEGVALDAQLERRKQLAKRSETMDTSYRLHGW